MSHKHNFFHRARHAISQGAHRVGREIVHLHNPKRVLRGTAKQQVYVNRVVGAGASFAASYVTGPIAGEAVAGGFAVGGGYLRTVQARNEGKASDARRLGRSERKREFINNSVAAGGGALTAGGVVAAGGGSVGQTVSAIGGGTQGGQLLYGGSLAPQAAALNPLTGGNLGAGALATANDLALPGSIPGASSALPLGGSAAVQAAQAAAVAGGAAPLGGGALAGGLSGGGFLAGLGSFAGSVGGAALAVLPTVLKGLVPVGGGHVAGSDASSGGGASGASGQSDDGSGGGFLTNADGSPNWLVIGGMVAGAFFLYKAVIRGR